MAEEARALEPSGAPRRVLTTRSAKWAIATARWLARHGVRPNAVSLAGVGLAIVACIAFAIAPQLDRVARMAALFVAAASVQLRLLCNLLDGMLAVEERLGSNTGEIYNDLPDRIADVVILVGAGYAARDLAYGPTLGWVAGVLAVFTAYVRVLGGSLGTRQYFIGPMAKQHRMFTLTLATLLAILETWFWMSLQIIWIGLAGIVVGSIVTAIRRTTRIVGELQAR